MMLSGFFAYEQVTTTIVIIMEDIVIIVVVVVTIAGMVMAIVISPTKLLNLRPLW